MLTSDLLRINLIIIGMRGQKQIIIDVVFPGLSLSLHLHRILLQYLQSNLLFDEFFDIFEGCSPEL